MNDLISRKEMIRAVDSLGEDYISYYKLLLLIGKMPSAEPERERGEWVKEKENVVLCHCSTCGYKVASALSNLFYNYCPNCGADMRGEHE